MHTYTEQFPSHLIVSVMTAAKKGTRGGKTSSGKPKLENYDEDIESMSRSFRGSERKAN